MTWFDQWGAIICKQIWLSAEAPNPFMVSNVMYRTVRLVLLFLLACLAISTASATTYYIAANGSDSNNGTAKTTPWAHLPGMGTWTGSHVPAAGDTFVFRGCDVWGNANFPIDWTWSGTSSSPITIDAEQTWYNTTNCPSSWNRPIFDGGGTEINPPATCGSKHFFLLVDGIVYVTFNWIEARNFFWSMGANSCYAGEGNILSLNSDYVTVDHWYFHNWHHSTVAGNTDIAGLIVTQANTSPACAHCTLQNSVIDNQDGDGADCSTTGSLCSGGGLTQWSMKNNICANVVECFYGPLWGPATIEVSGNNIYNVHMSFTNPTQVGGAQHPNCIETTGVITGTATLLVHDNYIHNIVTCEGLQVGNGPAEIDYIWNNVWDMSASVGANGPQLPQNSSTPLAGSSLYFWNNTVHWAAGCVRWTLDPSVYPPAMFKFQNNHCINDSLTVLAGTVPSGAVVSNNIPMTNAAALSQGYTGAEQFVYSPTAGTNSTVGAGTNLSSSWPSGVATKDTTYACIEQTIAGVVQSVCPARTPGNRPTTGAWDVGAYQFSVSSSGAPNPPIDLQAVVQ